MIGGRGLCPRCELRTVGVCVRKVALWCRCSDAIWPMHAWSCDLSDGNMEGRARMACAAGCNVLIVPSRTSYGTNGTRERRVENRCKKVFTRNVRFGFRFDAFLQTARPRRARAARPPRLHAARAARPTPARHGARMAWDHGSRGKSSSRSSPKVALPCVDAASGPSPLTSHPAAEAARTVT